MSQSKFLIVEDDVLISEYLKTIVKGLNHFVCCIASNYESAIKSIDEHLPNFALVDIRMQGKDVGIEIAKYLNKNKIPYVYITSFSDKTTLQEAILQQPFAYIVKPFSREEVEKTINFLIEKSLADYLIITQTHKQEKVRFADIKWIKSDNVYIEIHLKSRMILLREQLSKIQEELPEHDFIRVHRSYIVNKLHIDKIDNNTIFIGSEKIPISKNYKEDVNQMLSY
ncbi:MAG: response regulator transcription factor [Bacteroidales bacterium]|nr:response regulator transcription factor [Bacteroidales bacterium]